MINTRKIFLWIKIALIVYGVIGIILYYIQDYFLFHPKKLPSNHTFHFDQPFKEINIPFNKTDSINVIRFLSQQSVTKGAVIYYHGNKNNVEHYAGFVPIFTKNGYEVWMEDYPGFGKSSGERDEQKLYSQAWQVYKLATAYFPPDSIIIYGKSFGTGIASYMASGNDCRQLILETPYYSIPALFGHYAFIYPASRMSHYQMPTYKYLADVKVPVTMFHGTNDAVIPFKQAARLQKIVKGKGRLIRLEKGTHHNLAGFPEYKMVMDSLLR